MLGGKPQRLFPSSFPGALGLPLLVEGELLWAGEVASSHIALLFEGPSTCYSQSSEWHLGWGCRCPAPGTSLRSTCLWTPQKEDETIAGQMGFDFTMDTLTGALGRAPGPGAGGEVGAMRMGRPRDLAALARSTLHAPCPTSLRLAPLSSGHRTASFPASLQFFQCGSFPAGKCLSIPNTPNPELSLRGNRRKIEDGPSLPP